MHKIAPFMEQKRIPTSFAFSHYFDIFFKPMFHQLSSTFVTRKIAVTVLEYDSPSFLP
jgi:hypothetical protein